MKKNTSPLNPEEVNLLISFCDLTNFARISQTKTSMEIFNYLSHIYEITGEIVEGAKGQIIKFIGDSALITFPESEIDEGVLALKKLKEKIDKFNSENNYDSHLIIKAHFGKVIAGLMGTKNNKYYDIIGNEVNNTATIKSNGYSISVEAFKRLKSETQKLFKKYTPPSTYISIDQKHKD